jgi:CBS-domain-containing membrane protein
MLNKYRDISKKILSEHAGLSSPKQNTEGLSLDSDASALMIDFTLTPATTVNDSISVNDALELMRVNRIRALMVVGHNGEFAGIINAMDLMGSKPMLYATEAGISRTDVLVKNIMLPKAKLKAINRNDVEKSTLGDVLHTFKTLREQHILVVENEAEDMMICGLFSASDFKRALGMNIDSSVVANTFSDLERVINEHKEVM